MLLMLREVWKYLGVCMVPCLVLLLKDLSISLCIGLCIVNMQDGVTALL